MTVAPAFDDAFRAELEQLLRWRRDVRHFRHDPLAEGLFDRLLALTRFAPSVGHAQPSRFVRVLSPALREALADHVDGAVARAGEIYEGDERARYDALKLHGLREAPEIVAIFCDEDPAAGAGLGAATMPEARLYSVVTAIYTLWLAARAEGVGLGWVSILDPAWVTARLDVPPDWRFVALLCLGYPVAPSDAPELAERGWQHRIEGQAHVIAR